MRVAYCTLRNRQVTSHGVSQGATSAAHCTGWGLNTTDALDAYIEQVQRQVLDGEIWGEGAPARED
ncbi:hypothetical protein [Marilutibacter aestuarii]